MIKKATIGIVAALGAIVMALITSWVVHFGGPHGKLTACVMESTRVRACVKEAMCANRDFPQLTCPPN
jgi:hypothetical protein